jgi:hypothetical protein
MKLHPPMNYQSFLAFKQRLDEAQIAFASHWEALPYIGAPVATTWTLSVRLGLLSRRALVVGNDEEHLDTVRGYVLHHPEFAHRALSVRSARASVQQGQFALMERTGYEGGVPATLRRVILDSGGDEEDVNYALNVKEEKLLGYIPLNNGEAAQALAQIVEAGATSPVSREELVGAIEGWRDAAIAHLRSGDTSAGALATTLQKLANHWRGQPPSKGR